MTENIDTIHRIITQIDQEHAEKEKKIAIIINHLKTSFFLFTEINIVLILTITKEVQNSREYKKKKDSYIKTQDK
jgi:hypothetical protein